MDTLQNLKGKAVEIVYQGLIYKGILIGASGTEVYLQTSSNQVVLPMSGITSVREKPKPKPKQKDS